jgi:tRNA 5-methylaminomethyl-2-thiouridine biosynthesis bifunctional protein
VTCLSLPGPSALLDSDLPQRWQQRERFTILQTGFGAGLNFLATWACWQNDPLACARLHFVALAPQPLELAALRENHRHAGLDATLQALAQQLCEQWPVLLQGTQRLEFAAGRVVLTLVIGELSKTLPAVVLRADAVYLDELTQASTACEPFVLRGLSRLAAHGATLTAATLDASLREHLSECGFAIAAVPPDDAGRTVARFAPRFRVRRHEPPAPFTETCVGAARDAIVIGAGLAGCALVERLAARGWQVTLVERQAAAAQEASGNPAGVFHPIVTPDDSFAARLSRSGFLYALRYWASLHARNPSFEWQPAGLFVAAQSASEFAAMRATLERLALPHSYVELLSREQAALRTGVAPAYGGWLYASGGWVDPVGLCEAQLHAAGERLVRCFNQVAQRLERRDGRWHVIGRSGASIASAAVVVVANATEAQRLLGLRHLPLTAIRGQVTFLPDGPDPVHLSPHLPLIGDGYLVRLKNGLLMTGATYDLNDPDPSLRLNSQRENLDRLARLAPAAQAQFETASLAGRVGFRCVTSDRMPVIGPVAHESTTLAQAHALTGAHLADLPRQAGLYAAVAYGSRGLIWSALGAELIASQLDGEPWPIDRRLADGVDPARFLLRSLRQTSR